MPTNKQKWKISLLSLFLVMIIFNPITFKITNILGIFSPKLYTIGSSGMITLWGWTLHWIVFMLITRLMMK